MVLPITWMMNPVVHGAVTCNPLTSKFLLTISPLKHTLRSLQYRQWSPFHFFVTQILLVSTLQYIKRTVWRICILMLRCKGLMLANGRIALQHILVQKYTVLSSFIQWTVLFRVQTSRVWFNIDFFKIKIITSFDKQKKNQTVLVQRNPTCLAVIMLTSLSCLTRP